MKTVAFAAAARGALRAARRRGARSQLFPGTEGTFSADDDVALFDFSRWRTSRPSCRCAPYSYAGGTLADGTEVPAGGFDPVVSLFDASGQPRRGERRWRRRAGGPRDGRCAFDAFLSHERCRSRSATYTVAITQYDNFPVGPTLARRLRRAGRSELHRRVRLRRRPVLRLHRLRPRPPTFAFDVLGRSHPAAGRRLAPGRSPGRARPGSAAAAAERFDGWSRPRRRPAPRDVAA